MSRFENSDWQLGMPLPSRKDKHARKKEKAKERKDSPAVVKQQPAAVVQEALPKSVLQQFEQTFPVDQAEQLRELQAAREQVATASVAVPAPYASDWPVDLPEADLANADDDDSDEEAEPVIGKWTYRLLMFFVPMLLILALAYGKLGYVHQVPDLVRENVSAYEQGEGFLVLKPWWFGPPVYKMEEYLTGAENDFPQYLLNLHDFAGIVDDPIVLWQFQEDFLQK